MLRQVRCFAARVFIGAGQAELFVGPQHYANGAPRLQACLLDADGSRTGNGDAGTVVDGAMAQVPGIQVAADHHHFLRELAAGNFADDVGGLRHGQFAGRGPQEQLKRLLAGCRGRHLASQLVGVRVGQRHRGNARRVDGVDDAARVGEARIRVRAHGANDNGGSAFGTGEACAIRAAAHRRAVAFAFTVTCHALVQKHDTARDGAVRCRLQRLQAVEAHHLAM